MLLGEKKETFNNGRNSCLVLQDSCHVKLARHTYFGVIGKKQENGLTKMVYILASNK